MIKKISYILFSLCLLILIININKVNAKSNGNNYSYLTVMKNYNDHKIKSYSDAYHVITKMKHSNIYESHYKPNGKIKNGYSIYYFNKNNAPINYRVSYEKSNSIAVYNNSKTTYLKYRHLSSYKDACSIFLKDVYKKNHHNITFKPLSNLKHIFTFKAFKNNILLGKYTMKKVVRHYNKIVEDDSIYQLPSNDHLKITK
ncbi:hypothetical protein MOO46_05520 [Apilactobacillus apisilvae]|uniref:Surface layer protein A domain-containing protein n=1 Tax=Apilactobacillus apisilvae TaxID=2923364 RepID=A0ABY4PGK7_9LACO|nr:hypothetical protein [Apilactobacillus apisilvae]UQS84707.1 hypothetical protein MOO46_05520 [Apilactobacillus apisilvae]